MQALRVSHKISISPGHNGLTKVVIKEKPGTTVLIKPHLWARQVFYPYCIQVDADQHILCPIANNKPTTLKVGTYLAKVHAVDDPALDTLVGTVKELHNDLLPTFTQSPVGEDKIEKLKHLFKETRLQSFISGTTKSN